jgi:hypothetical protein
MWDFQKLDPTTDYEDISKLYREICALYKSESIIKNLPFIKDKYKKICEGLQQLLDKNKRLQTTKNRVTSEIAGICATESPFKNDTEMVIFVTDLKNNYLNELKEKCETFLRPSVNDLKVSNESNDDSDYETPSDSDAENVSDTKEPMNTNFDRRTLDVNGADELRVPPLKSTEKINPIVSNNMWDFQKLDPEKDQENIRALSEAIEAFYTLKDLNIGNLKAIETQCGSIRKVLNSFILKGIPVIKTAENQFYQFTGIAETGLPFKNDTEIVRFVTDLKNNYLNELRKKCKIFLKPFPSVNNLKASRDPGNQPLNPAQTNTPPTNITDTGLTKSSLFGSQTDNGQPTKPSSTKTPSGQNNDKNAKSWFARFRVPIITFLAVSIAMTCWYFKNSWFSKNPA